jgi:short-subunit dehydrogenase
LIDDGISVNTLVNNAGVGLHGPFGEQDVDAIGRLVTLNVTALTTALGRRSEPVGLLRQPS